MESITFVDFSILYWIQEHLRCAPLDGILGFFSTIGNSGMCWIFLSVILLFFRRTRLASVCMLCCLLVGYVSGELLLKNIIQRIRPCNVRPIADMILSAPSSYSFPSGHTTSSFTAATALYLCKPKWGKYAYIPAALIAFSRLYCFVHFPTDVLAGILLGSAIAVVLVPIVTKLCGSIPFFSAK